MTSDNNVHGDRGGDEMMAIDLLLAAGDTVEKVHQSVWFALLQRSSHFADDNPGAGATAC